MLGLHKQTQLTHSHGYSTDAPSSSFWGQKENKNIKLNLKCFQFYCSVVQLFESIHIIWIVICNLYKVVQRHGTSRQCHCGAACLWCGGSWNESFCHSTTLAHTHGSRPSDSVVGRLIHLFPFVFACHLCLTLLFKSNSHNQVWLVKIGLNSQPTRIYLS